MTQQHLFEPPPPWAAAPTMVLRPYQQAAVEAVYAHLRARDDNPCVVIPTGGGKTPVIATICRDAVRNWGGRVLVLAHVKELLEQAADKLRRLAPGVPVGLYSAGLNRRDRQRPITVAGIQSVYQKACEFDPFDLIIVDETHLIPPDGEGMYRQFLADAKTINPRVRLIGLTATPFRTKTGEICTTDGLLNHVCYEIGVRELITQGFLSPLLSKAGQARADLSSLHVRAGEFIPAEAEAVFDIPELVRAACIEVVAYAAERRGVLIFAAGVAHAEHVLACLREQHGQQVELVTGGTTDIERARILAEFTAGRLKNLVNVNVLTTGFDAPNIDCVVLLRPTNSPGLYYQMVGRGFRLHPGKPDCLVLDFGGNILRHGPVDALDLGAAGGRSKNGEAPAKECPQCHAAIACGFAICPDCGYEFPPPQRAQHEAQATDAGVLSGQVSTSTHRVVETLYNVHKKRGAGDDAPKTLRVDYLLNGGLLDKSEWICLEHPPGSFPRRKAETWWRLRSPDPVPDTAERACEIAEAGGLAETLEITVTATAGEKFDRVTDYVLGAMPEAIGVGETRPVMGEDECPF